MLSCALHLGVTLENKKSSCMYSTNSWSQKMQECSSNIASSNQGVNDRITYDLAGVHQPWHGSAYLVKTAPVRAHAGRPVKNMQIVLYLDMQHSCLQEVIQHRGHAAIPVDHIKQSLHILRRNEPRALHMRKHVSCITSRKTNSFPTVRKQGCKGVRHRQIQCTLEYDLQAAVCHY